MDLSMEIAERSLEVVRSSIEAAAARERDEAAARLLSELELEDASKKVRPLPLHLPKRDSPLGGAHSLAARIGCVSWQVPFFAGLLLRGQRGQAKTFVRPLNVDPMR